MSDYGSNAPSSFFIAETRSGERIADNLTRRTLLFEVEMGYSISNKIVAASIVTRVLRSYDSPLLNGSGYGLSLI